MKLLHLISAKALTASIMMLCVSGLMLGAWGRTPRVIAHRGYWTAPGSAQNSLRSLAKADSVGCYGSEFDVWLTADSVAVVHHDPVTAKGLHIEKTPAALVLAEKLGNGETIPTLDAYLAEAQNHPGMRLVCELKEHEDRLLEAHAVDLVLKTVNKYGLDDCTDYITFSPQAFRQFIEKAPASSEVYYLTGNYIPEQISFMGGAGIDYHLNELKNHPDWIKKCHDADMKVNVWTVNNPEDIQWCIDHDVDFITTNDPELTASMIAKKGADKIE